MPGLVGLVRLEVATASLSCADDRRNGRRKDRVTCVAYVRYGNKEFIIE